MGERVNAAVDHWLLPAPSANPGMLEMFRLRDREPVPKLVPWAGEFVGKYLISAIQILRMTERPELRATVSRTIGELIQTQAEDGYLGPFPKAVRLQGNWDLWGHYHCLLALLMWHEATGDEAALSSCRRAADLICNTFLDGPRRVLDAGSPEMNMAVLHGLTKLYRVSPQPRYLQMIHEIEKDWEKAGDYFRTGLTGTEFYQTPRPRWESLHDLQGLAELYLITGQKDYRSAFTHHWRSIARWDRRNTGGFSSGEQATGNPYAPTAIETCCTVAWMALSIDMLQLTADSTVGDQLELSLYNAALGAQHPSGRWCTYSTPMDGVREASAHSIVFQARAGTPELNCCSVNGPRGLGSLSEWAVLASDDGLAVNFYGPGSFQGKLADHTPVALACVSDYPFLGKVQLRVEPLAARRFKLSLRIPAWSQDTSAQLNGRALPKPAPGRYLELDRRWEPGDRIELRFDLRLRPVPGDREALGQVSVYRGPLLLAYDQALNPFDEKDVPELDCARLNQAQETIRPAHADPNADPLSPRLIIDLPAERGRAVRVCEFAAAGARGTRYRSWLSVNRPLPPTVVTRAPADAAHVSNKGADFSWTGPAATSAQLGEYQLQISPDAAFSKIAFERGGLASNHVLLDGAVLGELKSGQPYYWRVVGINGNGRAESAGPAAHFTVDPALEPANGNPAHGRN